MEIKFTDMDVIDINIKVAEQSLIKASIEQNTERKVKDLIYAQRSINNALTSFGIDIKDIEIKNRDLSSSKRQTPKKQSKFN